MPDEIRVCWPARQMYSRSAKIGRDENFAAFAAVLAAVTGEEVAEAEQTGSEPVEGTEFLGYHADRQTWRLVAGDASLLCSIEPILASQGVSGEHHSWRSEGLPGQLVIRGTALSSGREASFAALTIEGVDETRAAELVGVFAAAFPRIMSDAEIEAELGKR